MLRKKYNTKKTILWILIYKDTDCVESRKKICLNFLMVLKYMIKYAGKKLSFVRKGGTVTWPWMECALWSLSSRDGDAAELVHHSLCHLLSPFIRASERERRGKGIQSMAMQ